jgi:hypothetical protein
MNFCKYHDEEGHMNNQCDECDDKWWFDGFSNKKRDECDATLLFDSFTHIYQVFCLCFIYKMPWYSLFYVLKALLNVRFKKK